MATKYYVTCTDCGYAGTMGDVDEIFEREENHQDKHGSMHILEFEPVE